MTPPATAVTAADHANTIREALDYLTDELDRLADAFSKTALAYHTSNSHPRGFDICTWPQCRIARAALLGHASINTTASIYVHTRVADVAERMRAIEARESLEA